MRRGRGRGGGAEGWRGGEDSKCCLHISSVFFFWLVEVKAATEISAGAVAKADQYLDNKI